MRGLYVFFSFNNQQGYGWAYIFIKVRRAFSKALRTLQQTLIQGHWWSHPSPKSLLVSNICIIIVRSDFFPVCYNDDFIVLFWLLLFHTTSLFLLFLRSSLVTAHDDSCNSDVAFEELRNEQPSTLSSWITLLISSFYVRLARWLCVRGGFLVCNVWRLQSSILATCVLYYFVVAFFCFVFCSL